MKFICIHGHFYQPPRENPWLEQVELQDSAYPFHDWNERITAECYAPNAVARMIGPDGRIDRLVNNYARISFNFGPTLLSWLEQKRPDVYERILEADQKGAERFGGHGPALAQNYNHIIMPLADHADKVTQVLWGVRDFRRRFGRDPEGMWLAETAVDRQTLEVLVDHGIKFTILAPNQAAQARPIGSSHWNDVSGGRIDPTRAYLQRLSSGRSIALFFYDGPVSQAVAFEKLLMKGEFLAGRLLSTLRSDHPEGQLVHIATDGESYGHHHPHGDMALAYALEVIESTPEVRLTNYGEFLELHPPSWEVEIYDNSSWSCVHGVERWRSHCGCNTGRPGWRQDWRGPLREALDHLRNRARDVAQRHGGPLFRDLTAAFHDSLDLVHDRSEANQIAFLERHAAVPLNPQTITTALSVLEMLYQTQLMYTSCGWFFDEISGLETVQILMYAGRVAELAQEIGGEPIDGPFLECLERAPSNLPHLHPHGRAVYEKHVLPARVSLASLAAHYAISALFENYSDAVHLFSYEIQRDSGETHEAGRLKLGLGRATVTSRATRNARCFAYAALYFGDHNLLAGVVESPSVETFQSWTEELVAAFNAADTPQVIRLIDRFFGEPIYTIQSLYRDEQRKILKRLIRPELATAAGQYQTLYEQHLPLMRFLKQLAVPLPKPLTATAEVLFNTDLRWAMEDDEPDFDYILNRVREASEWGVTLDRQELSHKFSRMLARAADRLQEQPESLEALEVLAGGLRLLPELGLEPTLWKPQNVFFDLAGTLFPTQLDRAAAGSDSAREWIDTFFEVGDRLGINTDALRERRRMSESERPTVLGVLRDLLRDRDTPISTYRLQLRREFPFSAAEEIVPYLADLGISHVYASPILQARPGSPHGYDVCDHDRINPELGGEEGLERLASTLRRHGLGLILDVVPNHMAVSHNSNRWWADVLEHGASSRYAETFDIDWEPVNPSLTHQVLLPVLGQQYGQELESGRLRVVQEDGSFWLTYFEHRFPLAPQTYPLILSLKVPWLVDRLGEDHDHVCEYRSILTALGHLPPRWGLTPEKQADRDREVGIIKRRIASLTAECPEVKQAIEAAVAEVNGTPARPESFDLLDRLISLQSYRPAFWRVATDEINYRRFFDVNDLAAIRPENPRVFDATHRVFLDLLARVVAQGVRIDHPDGLWNPTGYFRRLQIAFVAAKIQRLPNPPPQRPGVPLNVEIAEAFERLRAEGDGRPIRPLYVVAEKILGEDEPLPREWAIDGTTGYDFVNDLNGLFVASEHEARFDGIFSRFIGVPMDFDELVRECKHFIMRTSIASEVNSLSHQLERISERNRHYRDYTLNTIRVALREFIARLSVYRTYTTPEGKVSDRDRGFVEAAILQAKRDKPSLPPDLFDFIRDTVLLANLDRFAPSDRAEVQLWVLRLQQVTGPITAKGIEDTAFYVYNRFISLNEVGGHPHRFGLSIAEFHRRNQTRLHDWPLAMIGTSTHDTKRAEDVRARLNVLSELPEEWEKAVESWRAINQPTRLRHGGDDLISAGDEYLLYQTLVGSWPGGGVRGEALARYRQRIEAYMDKAIKEAKRRTSWLNPVAAYDQAVSRFVGDLLADQPDNPFLDAFVPFADRIMRWGRFNSLAQVVLKLTSPGVPDTYQGTEVWDDSLVDPDNRRAVDYHHLQRQLAEIRSLEADPNPQRLIQAISSWLDAGDPRLKLFITSRLLHLRQRFRGLDAFDYRPLQPDHPLGRLVCAFRRVGPGTELLTAACIRPVAATRRLGVETAPVGTQVWSDLTLDLDTPAPSRWRDLITGRVLNAELAPSSTQAGSRNPSEPRVRLRAADLFAVLHVAVLQAESSKSEE